MCCFSGSLIHNLLLVRSKVNEYVKKNTASHIALHYILLSSLCWHLHQETRHPEAHRHLLFNGKFAWIELNGVDYGWTREGGNVGKYRIVLVEMGKVKLVLHGKVMEFEMDYYESPEKVNKTL